MSEFEDDLVEISGEIKEITQEEAEKNPQLLADEKMASEGVLDHEDTAKFEALELEADEEVILDEEDKATGAGGGGGAGGAPIGAHQRRALKLAVSQKGMREEPRGSNNNKYSRYFGFGRQFWCADFVAFCVDRSGNRDKKVPWGYPSAVKNITAWGQRNGTIHSRPQRGDIFTRKDGMHTGFVLTARGSSFMTIEGNTSEPPGAPRGDFYVASHSRDASNGLYFFVRDDFRDA
jgi:CHAP domain